MAPTTTSGPRQGRTRQRAGGGTPARHTVPPDGLRAAVLSELYRQGKSRYWLAKAAHKAGYATAETIFRFLRGERDTTADVISGLMGLLGMEVRAADGRLVPPPPPEALQGRRGKARVAAH